jgi:hypothetical protein
MSLLTHVRECEHGEYRAKFKAPADSGRPADFLFANECPHLLAFLNLLENYRRNAFRFLIARITLWPQLTQASLTKHWPISSCRRSLRCFFFGQKSPSQPYAPSFLSMAQRVFILAAILVNSESERPNGAAKPLN